MLSKEIKNFLPEKVLLSIPKHRGFNPFSTKWYDCPLEREYQQYIIEEASSFVDLSSMVGIEEWFHNPCFIDLPGEHYDKNEKLWLENRHLEFPLCSCVLYLKVENLMGADLLVDRRIKITPESNKLVLMKPGVIHEVTSYESGVRTSINLNPWYKKV